MIPAALLDLLSSLGHFMSFAPFVCLFVYLVFYHGNLDVELEPDMWF